MNVVMCLGSSQWNVSSGDLPNTQASHTFFLTFCINLGDGSCWYKMEGFWVLEFSLREQSLLIRNAYFGLIWFRNKLIFSYALRFCGLSAVLQLGDLFGSEIGTQYLGVRWCCNKNLKYMSLAYFFFVKYFFPFLKLEYINSSFTLQCQFLLYSKLNQLHLYPIFFGFPSHLDYHRAPSRISCAIQ